MGLGGKKSLATTFIMNVTIWKIHSQINLLAALKPNCCIGNFSNFHSPIRAFIRVSSSPIHTFNTWENLGAYITYIGVFFIFLLTLITGYAWRAIDYIKIQFFSATVTNFAFRAKLVTFFLVFKFI
jgi:hypothetical protein